MNVGLVGYGEVGKITVGIPSGANAGWVGAWDILMRDAAAAPAMNSHAAKAGVEAVGSMATLTAKADVIISAVTASQAGAVADEATKSIRPGTWFMDLNSCSPGVKQRSSERVDGAGGRYVESAVMTTVPGYGIRVPMLLGGRHASAFRDLMSPFGLDMQIADERVGVASATKMCRSVMIKGLESLLVESPTSARYYGVEERAGVAARDLPELDWEKIASYMIMRTRCTGSAARRRCARSRRRCARPASSPDGVGDGRAAGLHGEAEGRRGLAHIAKGADWRAYADKLLGAERAETAA
jgi:3-hydroxyisobutyrate dehydrogenase-like beta-hydroxyacid dehydrogenase